MHWFLDPIKYHYADFKGRATREEYWMFTLISVLIGIAVAILLLAILGADSMMFATIVILFGIFGLLLFMPSTALMIRRLHDTGRSGWWWFIGFIPYVGGIILVVLCCLASQKGTNKYGQNKYEASVPEQPPVIAQAITE